MTNKKKRLFLLAGLTGGPIVPLLSYINRFPEYEIIFVGVKNGFEETLAREYKVKLIYLPKAKQNIHNTKGIYLMAWFFDIFRYIKISFLLLFSVFISAYYLIKYRPKAIITAGSFLSISFFYSQKIVKLFVKTQWIVHQQDVVPTKSNLIVVKQSNLTSVVFDQTKKKYRVFKNAIVTKNLVDVKRFDAEGILIRRNYVDRNDKELFDFINKKNAPLLFIFGGGSGAEYINEFIFYYIALLTQHFCVIHVTGKGKATNMKYANKLNYIVREQLDEKTQTYTLVLSDLVVSRAGMGTIAELLYTNKPAYLIPLPNTHQEENALILEEYFTSFVYSEYKFKPQKFHDNWIKTIIDWKNISKKTVNVIDYNKSLNKYFESVSKLLRK